MRINKILYLILIGIFQGLTAILSILTAEAIRIDMWNKTFWIILLLIPASISSIINITLIYRMWDSLNKNYARTTPLKALLFLLIPVFNLYWQFQVFFGFANDFNRYLYEKKIDGIKKMPAVLFLIFSIFIILSFIPVAGYIIIGINYFLYLFLVNSVCNGINNLYDLESKGQML